MKRWRKYIVAVLILIAMCIFIFRPEMLGVELFTGSSFLLGSLISWFTIILFPTLFYLLIPLNTERKIEKHLKIILFVCMVLAVLWGFISFLLSESWAFNFKDIHHFYIWIIYTAIAILSPIVVLLIYSILSIFKSK